MNIIEFLAENGFAETGQNYEIEDEESSDIEICVIAKGEAVSLKIGGERYLVTKGVKEVVINRGKVLDARNLQKLEEDLRAIMSHDKDLRQKQELVRKVLEGDEKEIFAELEKTPLTAEERQEMIVVASHFGGGRREKMRQLLEKIPLPERSSAKSSAASSSANSSAVAAPARTLSQKALIQARKKRMEQMRSISNEAAALSAVLENIEKGISSEDILSLGRLSQQGLDQCAILAIAKEKESLLGPLIVAGADIGSFGFKAMELAIKRKRIGCCRALIAAGMNLASCDQEKNTPLHIAASLGDYEIYRVLINAGADSAVANIHGKIPQDNMQEKLQMNERIARRQELKRELADAIRKREKPENILDQISLSQIELEMFLHHAALHGCVECLEPLLNRGANLLVRNADGENAIQVARKNNQKEFCVAAEKAVEERRLTITDAEARIFIPPLAVLCDETMLRRQMDFLLLEAIEKSKTDVDSALAQIKRVIVGGLWNQEDFDSLLHLAAGKGGSVKLIETFLDMGAKVNSANFAGSTALHRAARDGIVDAVRFLVERGASVNISDSDGNTPLHLAARSGDMEKYIILMDYEADPMARNKNGFMPIDYCSMPNVVEQASASRIMTSQSRAK